MYIRTDKKKRIEKKPTVTSPSVKSVKHSVRQKSNEASRQVRQVEQIDCWLLLLHHLHHHPPRQCWLNHYTTDFLFLHTFYSHITHNYDEKI